MSFTGQILQVGDITDGPIPQMGPARGKPLLVEIRTASTPAGSFFPMEVTEDAAMQLVQKLTAALRERGFLSDPDVWGNPNVLK